MKSSIWIPVVIIKFKYLNFKKLEVSGYTELKFVFTFFLSNVTSELDDLASERFLLKTSLEKKIGYFDALNFTRSSSLNCKLHHAKDVSTGH